LRAEDRRRLVAKSNEGKTRSQVLGLSRKRSSRLLSERLRATEEKKTRRRRRKTNARDGYFLGFVLDRGRRGSFQSLSSGHGDVKFGRRRIGRVMFTTREFLFLCAFVVFVKRQDL